MSQHRNFYHPFQPYSIQLDFMNAVYECIQTGKVGIFESPTGTGKSLSLICGSLTWLRDSQIDALDAGVNDDEPAWVIEHATKARRTDYLQYKRDLEAKLQKIRDKEARQRKRYESGEALPKRQRVAGNSVKASGDDEEDFVLEDYDSDKEVEAQATAHTDKSGLSGRSLEMAIKLGLAIPAEKETDEDVSLDQTKIFFCSRTHSQLIQFANELRRVKIPLIKIEEMIEDQSLVDEIKHLSLGSRKNLCINEDVRSLGSTTAINERCLELQQSKTVSKKCSFLPNKENETLVHQFRDYTLAKIRDIEDLGKLGERIGICPYYATRATIKPSEVVTLPYPLLLQKSAREALGISLKNHIVIIDEAHNLMDAIAGIQSAHITLLQLSKARAQLTAYLQKFRNKLKGKNRVYVAQTVRLIDSLVIYIQSISDKKDGKVEGAVKVSDLLTGKGADQINLYKLVQYLQESKLARKVDGYTMFSNEKDSKAEASTPVLTLCQSFFQALSYPATEGRFFYVKGERDVTLKYMLLDSTSHFRDIVEDAKAVILAGGTMSPMDDYKQHLFPYLEPERLMTLSCGHVIPPENMIAVPLSKTSTGMDLDFTFEKRNHPNLLDSLGETLVQLTAVIPDGVVVFFPSYAYLEQVLSRWKSGSIFDHLNAQKTIVYESKSDVAVTADVLEQYSSIINSTTDDRGAILFSVVGGKLSEGINFSDKLGRAVFIVGLPFPNIQSAEWKAKLEYIEQQRRASGGTAAEAKDSSRSFYENACMRAVNQCIGRAIRHRNDYAGIFLLDRRYSTARIQSKLPGWIRQGIDGKSESMSLQQLTRKVQSFFDSKV